MASPWRFELRLIDKSVLVRYMEYRGVTCGSLAQRVGCSRATIGHLRSGHTKTVRNDKWAKAIERELNAPPGSLFVPNVYRVAADAA